MNHPVSPTQRIATMLLGEPLRPWLERQRVLGLSAQAIAWELRQATDGEVVVSDQTILNWLAEDA